MVNPVNQLGKVSTTTTKKYKKKILLNRDRVHFLCSLMFGNLFTLSSLLMILDSHNSLFEKVTPDTSYF